MSLASKIAALAASLVIATTLTLFFLVQNAIERTVVEQQSERLARATTQAASELRTEIDRGSADVRVAAASPSVAGVVQAIVSSKGDFAGHTSVEKWEERLARYFRALLAANPNYIQARLIGITDDGSEIVRVDRTPEGILRTPSQHLQQKGNRPYFKNTVTQRPGVVHVSSIEFNQEHGKVEEPHRPVVRVGSVVTTEDGDLFGIVVINIDFTRVLDTMMDLSAEPLELYLTTAQGDYIVAPDSARTFGFDLGHRYLIQNDLPWLAESFQGDALLGKSRSYRADDILTRTLAVHAGEGNLQQSWMVVGTLDLKKAAAAFLNFEHWLIAAALTLIALGTMAAIFFAGRITAPLRNLTAALRNIGEGSFDVDLGDLTADAELKDVRSAFETMRSAVQSREQGMRDAQARIEAIVENTVNPIITFNERGSILHANNATARMFGYSAAELAGRNVSMLLPTPYREAHDGYLKNYLATGNAEVIGKGREVLAIRKDGSVLPVDLGVSEVRLASGRVFVATLTDLSEMKKLEKIKLEKIEGALKLEKMKGEFVATVSHELRTPLTSIKGCLALLTSDRFGNLPEKARSMIEIAHGNSDRLARLINDILDIEKIKAGQMTFSMQKVVVKGLLEDAARAYAAYAQQYGVSIKLMPVDEALTIQADPDRAAQALANLISNAVKYSPKGNSITLAADQRKGFVRLSVSDKGAGIPKEFKDQVFTRFAQADSSDARQKGGTGLGLSITKAIAEAHGGAIGYRSKLGKGTTFYVDLPVAAAVETVDAPADKQRILVCEDDPDIALLLRLIVEDAGYEAQVCQTADEARTQLDCGEFASMTLDLTLPDADGLTLLRELRRSAKHESLPVIVVSGSATAGKKSLNAGAFSFVDWLDKPIDPEQLRASIKRSLDGLGDVTLRILHVEDDKDHRAIVADVVGESGEITYAGSIASAADMLRSRQFDMVILDLLLPDGPGEQLLSILNSNEGAAAPAVLVYSIKELPATLTPYVDAALVKSRTDTMLLRSQIHRLVRESRRKAAPATQTLAG